MKSIRTDTLEIAFVEAGSPEGWPVVLTHGFPYDVHAFDEVVPRLAAAGARVIVPYLPPLVCFAPLAMTATTSILLKRFQATAAKLLPLSRTSRCVPS